jgi:hypothetical protein
MNSITRTQQRARAQIREAEELLAQLPPLTYNSDGSLKGVEHNQHAPRRYEINWAFSNSISSWGHKLNVLGDGNCLLYAFQYGLLDAYPDYCAEDCLRTSLFGEPENFRCGIRLRMHLRDWAIRKMVQLMDHTNPLFLDSDGVAITNVYTDRRRSLRSDGTYTLDGTWSYLAQVDRMYNPNYFNNLTAEVLKSDFYMDPVFAIPMLCMMCEVTVFLYSIQATRDGNRSRIGTTVFFYRPDDKKVQRFTWWGNDSRIVAPFPGSVSIYFDRCNHYNRISPLKTAILSSVPVLTKQYLLQRARSENQDNPITVDETPPMKLKSQHTDLLNTEAIQVDITSPATELDADEGEVLDADEGEVLLATQNEDAMVNTDSDSLSVDY